MSNKIKEIIFTCQQCKDMYIKRVYNDKGFIDSKELICKNCWGDSYELEIRTII